MAKIKKIETNEAPKAVGPYSQGTQVNGFIFVSGQLPVDPKTGQLVEEDIKVQTDRVIENIKSILKAAGLDLNHVVRCDVFLKDMNEFAAMNEVYAEFLGTVAPARSTVEVARLPRNVRVLMEAVAVVEK